MTSDAEVAPTPPKLVAFVVNHPCASCCGVIWSCLLMIVILLATVIGDANRTGAIPITLETADYVLKDERSVAMDSLVLASDLVIEERGASKGKVDPVPPQSERMDSLIWLYEAQTADGMFTEEGLADMRKAESVITSDKEGWPKYCRLQYPTSPPNFTNATLPCSPPVSSLNIFYAAYWNETLVQDVLDRLKVPATLATYQKLSPCIEYGIGCQLVQPVDPAEENLTKGLKKDLDAITMFWNGNGDLVPDIKQAVELCAYLKILPTWVRYVDFYFDKQFSVANPVSKYVRSLTEFGGPLEDETLEDEPESEKLEDYMVRNWYSGMEEVVDAHSSSVSDTLYFFPPLLSDVILILLATDISLAFLSIIFVFLYLWYSLGSGFLAIVGILEISLSVPCAWFFFRCIFQIKNFSPTNALTIFIIAAIGADDIFVFIDAYKRSAFQGPAVNKDLASRMAWVWTKSGAAMTITSATTSMAFLSTCFTPLASTQSFGIFAALVVLFDFALVMTLFFSAVVISHNRLEREPRCVIPFLCGCCTKDCICDNQSPTPTETILAHAESGQEAPPDKVTVFFSTTVADCVLNVKTRLGLMLVFLAILCPAIYFLTQLEPTSVSEQLLPEKHPLQRSITIFGEFPASSEDSGLAVYFTWGLGDVNRKGVKQLLNVENIGQPVFESFSFTPECQTKILAVCKELEDNKSPERVALIKRAAGGIGSVQCVLRDLLMDQGTNKTGTRLIQTANVSGAIKNFFNDPPATVDELQLNQLGYDGKELKFISVEVESQELTAFGTTPEAVTRRNYDGFIKIAGELEKIVGNSCGAPGVLMTDRDTKFIFMNNQKVYTQSAIQGSIIGVALAFLVLAISTRSLLLAGFSTLSITLTICTVIGTVTAIGWTLGTTESILISILAGFSVDYVVHLAHAYSHAHGPNHSRIRTAFGEMGTPVLSGMITSVVASLPLFACQIVFFAKFGSFLCFTILWSWMFANFFFMSMLATFGSDNGEEQGQGTKAIAVANPSNPDDGVEMAEK